MPPYRTRSAAVDMPEAGMQFTPDIGSLVSPMTGIMALMESRRQESAQLTQASLAGARQAQQDNLRMVLGFAQEQRASRLQETQIAAEALKIGAEVEKNRLQIAMGNEMLRNTRMETDRKVRAGEARRQFAPMLAELRNAAASHDFPRHQFLFQQLSADPRFADLPDELQTSLAEESAAAGQYVLNAGEAGDAPVASLYRDAKNGGSATRLQSAAALLDSTSVGFRDTLAKDLGLNEVDLARVNSLTRVDRMRLAEWRNSEDYKELRTARRQALMAAGPDADTQAISDQWDEVEERDRANFLGVPYSPWSTAGELKISPQNLGGLIDRLAKTPVQRKQLESMETRDVALMGVKHAADELGQTFAAENYDPKTRTWKDSALRNVSAGDKAWVSKGMTALGLTVAGGANAAARPEVIAAVAEKVFAADKAAGALSAELAQFNSYKEAVAAGKISQPQLARALRAGIERWGPRLVNGLGGAALKTVARISAPAMAYELAYQFGVKPIQNWEAREIELDQVNKEVGRIRNDLGALVSGVYRGNVSPLLFERGFDALNRYNEMAAERGMAPLDPSYILPTRLANRAARSLQKMQQFPSPYPQLGATRAAAAAPQPRSPPPGASAGGVWAQAPDSGQWLYNDGTGKVYDAGGALLTPAK